MKTKLLTTITFHTEIAKSGGKICHESIEPYYGKPAIGKKVVYRISSPIVRDIKIIAAKKETTLNDLFVEGINLILEKYKQLL